MDQLFINRVFWNISRIETTPARFPPRIFFLGRAPLESNRNLLSRRNLGHDFGRDQNLAVKCYLSTEIGNLHTARPSFLSSHARAGTGGECSIHDCEGDEGAVCKE